MILRVRGEDDSRVRSEDDATVQDRTVPCGGAARGRCAPPWAVPVRHDVLYDALTYRRASVRSLVLLYPYARYSMLAVAAMSSDPYSANAYGQPQSPSMPYYQVMPGLDAVLPRSPCATAARNRWSFSRFLAREHRKSRIRSRWSRWPIAENARSPLHRHVSFPVVHDPMAQV